MPKVKVKVEPLSIDLSPLNKKKNSKEKLGIIKKKKNRKMMSWRLRVEFMNVINDIERKLFKKTQTEYSQSAIVEMALTLAKNATVEELLEAYADTFRL